MKLLLSLLFVLSLSISGLLACTDVPANSIPPVNQFGVIPVKKTMRSFGSEQELARFLRDLAEKRKRRERAKAKINSAASNAQAPVAADAKAEAQSKDSESITNVQHAGVDEGGIVKMRGDTLVVSVEDVLVETDGRWARTPPRSCAGRCRRRSSCR